MPRLISLDLLRTFLAFVVMFFHYEINIFPSGGLVVDLFFIMSGFILSKQYENSEDYRGFIINRITRIFPLFLVALFCRIINSYKPY